MEVKKKNEGEMYLTSTIVVDDDKKRKCIECGKDLRLFEGYRHPTMGSHHLICRNCFQKVENNVKRWGRFVLWNSFSPEAPDPTFIDIYPFPQEETEISHNKPKHPKHIHLMIISYSKILLFQ